MAKYFSFFGEVEAVSLPEEERVIRAFADLEKARMDMDQDVRDWHREVVVPAQKWAVETYARLYGPLGEQRAEELGRDNSVTARAYEVPLAVQARDIRLLVVEGPDWIEWGFVKWPLEFTAPAAIAGSCCAPRYGLERG